MSKLLLSNLSILMASFRYPLAIVKSVVPYLIGVPVDYNGCTCIIISG